MGGGKGNAAQKGAGDAAQKGADDGYGSTADPGEAALACLQKHSKIEVHEKASLTEMILEALGSDFQVAQRYNVFGVPDIAKTDEEPEEIFYVAESTDCCMRQQKLYCGDCAPWEADIFHVELNGNRHTRVFEIRRPWTCTCCCFN